MRCILPWTSPQRVGAWLELPEHKYIRHIFRNTYTCKINVMECHVVYLFVFFTVHPCTISQKKIQLGAQFCLIYLFISLLYVFRPSTCPSSGENCCIYATLVFVTLYGWRLVCWLDWNPTSRPDATHTEWQIPVWHTYSDFLLMMSTWMPKHVEKRNK